ncbi:lectin subunit alpha-like [Stomoxys calcitrans]|uniref:lectin subunit alpha-like n=1 Tax=Stomoxys calcitrans TaxID=35570 RepID=UPI0027E26D41|nr:lectin subunit alpha-like [Stomoxys calcitrans]
MKTLICVFLLLQTVNMIHCQDASKLYRSDKNRVYYIEHEQFHDWFQALTACARMKMNLLTLETREKSDDVNSLVLKTFGKSIRLWVGAYAVGPTHQFTWISNGNPFVYSFWNPNQPDFVGKQEFCAHIGWGKEMQWNDHQCSYKCGFVCEYPNKQSELGDLERNRKYSGLSFQINNLH